MHIKCLTVCLAQVSCSVPVVATMTARIREKWVGVEPASVSGHHSLRRRGKKVPLWTPQQLGALA